MKPAEMIKEARKKKNWTQRQLADAVGVSAAFITQIESEKSFPSYERCMALANVLELAPDKLWAEIEKARLESVQARIRTRGKAVRTALRAPHPNLSSDVETAYNQIAAEIASDLAANPDLLTAYRNLKTALADARMRETILNSLELFAQTADSQIIK